MLIWVSMIMLVSIVVRLLMIISNYCVEGISLISFVMCSRMNFFMLIIFVCNNVEIGVGVFIIWIS